MSVLSRVFAPPATNHELAGLVSAILTAAGRPAPRSLPGAADPGARPKPQTPHPSSAARKATRPGTPPPSRLGPGRVPGVSGLGTGAARFTPADRKGPMRAAPGAGGRLPLGAIAAGPDRLGLSALDLPVRPTAPAPVEEQAEEPTEQPARRKNKPPELYCPPAFRDDPALGEAVNERLVEWAEEVGIYPGHLDMVRQANFGRLMMLAHPESDDPDRLLAAAKCGLAEWAVDDHIVDCEVEEPAHEKIGQRLAICHSVIDQAQLPLRYAPQLEEVVRKDPVAMALRDSLNNLLNYASTTQVRRLRHELAIMFVAYGQEGMWHTTGHRPPVWEYLMHRHENSFIPCMVLVDAIAGYEVPMAEFSDPRVRRAFNLAGTATVLMNDLYSMGKEDPSDFSLPMLIAGEEKCSLEEAVEISVDIHDELMHTFEAEAAALSAAGSPELRRFFTGAWAWVAGNREWHAGSARYNAN